MLRIAPKNICFTRAIYQTDARSSRFDSLSHGSFKKSNESEAKLDKVNINEYTQLMAKTVTIRMDDKSYKLLKNAAISQKRSISNFIEYAAVNFTIEDNFVSDYEMADIQSDSTLMSDLKRALNDVKSRRFSDVK